MKASGCESTTNVHFRKVKTRAISVLVNRNFECNFSAVLFPNLHIFARPHFPSFIFNVKQEFFLRFACSKVDAHKI